MLKKCTRCNVEKEISEFHKRKDRKTAVVSNCKSCVKEKTQEYKKSINGIVNTIFWAQVANSKIRNNPPPLYSKKELKEWILNRDNFSKLYEDWKNSNYNQWFKPSVDRINDYKGYSFDNIKLTTFKKNNEKGHLDRRNGINNKMNREVFQYDLENNFIQSFHSVREASRKTGIYNSNISACCLGKKYVKSAGGFIWKYHA